MLVEANNKPHHIVIYTDVSVTRDWSGRTFSQAWWKDCIRGKWCIKSHDLRFDHGGRNSRTCNTVVSLPKSGKQIEHTIILTDPMNLLQKVESGISCPDWHRAMQSSAAKTSVDLLPQSCRSRREWRGKHSRHHIWSAARQGRGAQWFEELPEHGQASAPQHWSLEGKRSGERKLPNDLCSTRQSLALFRGRPAQTIGALTKLKTIWKDKNIALSSKIRLMRSLVISIFLYTCETWTLTAELEKNIQTTEMRCFRRLFGISYRDHVTNEKVGNRIRQAIGPYDDLLTTVKKRKLRWYGHKTRSTGLAKMILQGTVQGRRRRGRQKKEMGRQRNGMDRIKVGWSSSKGRKQRRMDNSGCPIILGAPTVN